MSTILPPSAPNAGPSPASAPASAPAAAAPAADASAFADLGICARLVEAVHGLGFTEPTPIQAQAIPALLSGRDVLGQAATGTGKTAAFGLPLLQQVMSVAGSPRSRPGMPQGLVLVPTRELAIQVAQALSGFARGTGLTAIPIYGGQDMRLQLRALRAAPEVVVATPGRLLDHLKRNSLSLEAVRQVVLDEADEMLDRGFADDLAEITERLPEGRQTAMFSATLPSRVAQMARHILQEPVTIQLATKRLAQDEVAKVQQVAYLVPQQQKVMALARLLCVQDPQAALIFCRTRADVDTLHEALARGGHRCEALHGGMTQASRDKVMQRFRQRQIALLIATDVAARGLDIDHVSHVFNYDLPEAPEVYVHRIGRTGRAGRSGVAISLVKPSQRRLMDQVARHMQIEIAQGDLPTPAAMQRLRAERTLVAVQAAIDAAPSEAANDPLLAQAQLLTERYTPLQLARAALEALGARQAASSGPDMDTDLDGDPSGSGHGAPGGHAGPRPGGARGRGRPQRPTGGAGSRGGYGPPKQRAQRH